MKEQLDTITKCKEELVNKLSTITRVLDDMDVMDVDTHKLYDLPLFVIFEDDGTLDAYVTSLNSGVVSYITERYDGHYELKEGIELEDIPLQGIRSIAEWLLSHPIKPKEFKFCVTEKYSKEITIKADSIEEAREKAEEVDIIMSPCNYVQDSTSIEFITENE